MANAGGSDVVVIGAGLSGLAASLALARSGRSVTLLEAAGEAGGSCSTAVRSGFTFNNGAVYVAVPSLLRFAFRRLGLDFDREVPMARIPRPHATSLANGTIIRLSTAEDSSVEGRNARERTQLLRDGLGKLRNRWGPVYRTLVDEVLPFEPSLPRAFAKLWRYLPRMSGHVDKLIASYFPDADLQAAVASILLYTGLPPERLPASQVIGLLALLEEGFHLPYDGMGAISAALQRELQRHSVSVRFNTTVKQVLVNGGKVQGVELADGERINARYVVATCSGFELARRLLPATAVPRGLKKRARRAPLSHRAVSIQFGCAVTAPPDAFVVNHVPPMHQQGEMHADGPGIPRWLAYTCPSQVVAGFAPPGKSVIELFAPANGIDSVAEWTRKMTEDTVARYSAALRERLPGFDIEITRVLDPRNFAESRHLYEGALYGIAPGARPDAFFPHRTAVQGLYLAGQTTFPGYGVPSVIMSGIQAVQALEQDAQSSSSFP